MPRGLNKSRVEAAFSELLRALGAAERAELAQTPARAADLWLNHLLRDEQTDPARALGAGRPSSAISPIWVRDVGVHLVCPHHLTIAFGTAHVGYIPNGRVVGFGALARLLGACTARFVLQEEAAQRVADTVIEVLDAKAAVCAIDAVHPCHNVLHGRSHAARAYTLGVAGKTTSIALLTRTLAMSGRPRKQPRKRRKSVKR